jgi:hypothetical protein
MMQTGPISRRRVSSYLLGLAALTAGCATKGRAVETAPAAAAAPAPPPVPEPAAPPPAAPPPAEEPVVLSFEEAVASSVRAVFTTAPAEGAGTIKVVIDPLIDGVTGYQSKATQSIQERITVIVKQDFPRYSVQRITPASLNQQPRVLIGTFTPVNSQNKPVGQREAYRFCLVMGDLKSGKIIAKAVRRSRIEQFDATPTAAFGDSPVWTEDPSVLAYIASCQGSSVGDPIKAAYIDGLLTAALVSEAADAYDERHYAEALNLYRTARQTPAGDQLRVYNGIYLCQIQLGHTDAASAAFHDLVDYGLRKKRLAVKFLFRPGSVRFVADAGLSGNYGMWMRQIAAQSLAAQVCLQITGHTSASGLAVVNDRLSLLRAEYIQSQLNDDEPALKNHTVAAGAGSRENLIGTGRDDATDALDRRVELMPIDRCS